MPAWAADKEQVASPEAQQRELIYCADLMTHEEREAYRECTGFAFTWSSSMKTTQIGHVMILATLGGI
jgi:hypothetical protein